MTTWPARQECQHRCETAADRLVGEPDDLLHKRQRPWLSGEALLRVVGPGLPPDLLGKRGERQDVRACAVQVGADLRGRAAKSADAAIADVGGQR
jgi:hypothetical protein